MSASTRMHGQPTWLRIKAIGSSRAHRAMRRQTLGLPLAVCPQVDEKVKDVVYGRLTIGRLREWLGQVHEDYSNALTQAEEKLVKMRIQLRHEQRTTRSLEAEITRVQVGMWFERPDGQYVLVTNREHYEVDGRVLWSWNLRRADFSFAGSMMLGTYRELRTAIDNGRLLGLPEAGKATRKRLKLLHDPVR